MTRTFSTAPANRQQVNMILGLVGPSSSGKTWTALELATGIQSVTGGDIELIDTEHGRGLFYAENFKFNHTDFGAPFASLDYLEAIKQAAKRSKVIIVDSLSHEHESEGGMLDYQEQELTRMAGHDYAKRERMQMLAWAKPKAARRKLLQGLTQIDAHIILCFRAKNTSKPVKNREGKNVVEPMGFVPIAGEEFVFEASLSMLFHPNAKGVPTWNPELPGERIAVKLPKQFEWLKDQRGPIARADGARLAEWAAGGAPQKKTPVRTKEVVQEDEPIIIGSDLEATETAQVRADTLEGLIDTSPAPEAVAAYNDAIKADWWNVLKASDKERTKVLRDKVAVRAAELRETA